MKTSKLSVQFAWYLREISFTERTTRIIRANVFCECSRQCERIYIQAKTTARTCARIIGVSVNRA